MCVCVYLNINTPGLQKTFVKPLALTPPLWAWKKGALRFVHWNPCPLKVDALISENVRLMNWTAFRCHGMLAIMAISTMRCHGLQIIMESCGIMDDRCVKGKWNLCKIGKASASDHSFSGQVAWLQWKISWKLCWSPKIYNVPLCFWGLLFWFIFDSFSCTILTLHGRTGS